MKTSILKYSYLVGVNALYASVSIATKYASQHEFLSKAYCVGVICAVFILGLYAVCWQQILKRVDLSTAYMFKGTSLVFIMLFAFALFGEQITLMNTIGSVVIVCGIVLFAKTDN